MTGMQYIPSIPSNLYPCVGIPTNESNKGIVGLIYLILWMVVLSLYGGSLAICLLLTMYCLYSKI